MNVAGRILWKHNKLDMDICSENPYKENPITRSMVLNCGCTDAYGFYQQPLL